MANGVLMEFNQYMDTYENKKITIDDVLSKINSGDSVAFSFGAMEPISTLGSLHKIKDRVTDVKLLISATTAKHEIYMSPEMNKSFSIDSLFFMGPLRKAYSNGLASYQPGHLHNCVQRSLSHNKPKIFIGSATPMDKHGYVRLSLSLAVEKELMEAADIIIMEINPNLPSVGGDTEVHISDIDYIVEVDNPAPTTMSPEITDIERNIAQYVSSLVNDGDTIQLGVGSIPDAVASSFMDKKDLGVHTELITPSMGELIKAGVITNKKKTLNKGKTVGAFILGDNSLYELVDNNPSIVLKSASYTNDPYIIAQNDNMVSINSAIQVDLTGQICSESIGTRHFSGTGGQNDFAVGATHSKNGKSIITLKSTAKNGTISTIRPILDPGAVVTMSRNNIDYIITEYGIAHMKGRSIRERVENLISVAHPDFRQELKDEAKKYGIY